jgi:hypothetical protein
MDEENHRLKVTCRYEISGKFANVLKKIDQLEMLSNSLKSRLNKLVITYKIKSIVKLLKYRNNSVTIHAKIEPQKKINGIMKNSDDVIIKVSPSLKVKTPLYAYSRNIYNEKIGEENSNCTWNVQSNSQFMREKLTIYNDNEIVIMKMLNGCKSIEQMIQLHPNDIFKFYVQVMNLFILFKEMDISFRNDRMCGLKNTVWWNEKWVFIDADSEPDYTKINYELGVNQVTEIIQFFKTHGLNDDLLKEGLRSSLNPTQKWKWSYEIYIRVFNENFSYDGVPEKEFNRAVYKYRNVSKPKHPKVSKKERKCMKNKK